MQVSDADKMFKVLNGALFLASKVMFEPHKSHWDVVLLWDRLKHRNTLFCIQIGFRNCGWHPKYIFCYPGYNNETVENWENLLLLRSALCIALCRSPFIKSDLKNLPYLLWTIQPFFVFYFLS